MPWVLRILRSRLCNVEGWSNVHSVYKNRPVLAAEISMSINIIHTISVLILLTIELLICKDLPGLLLCISREPAPFAALFDSLMLGHQNYFGIEFFLTT